jgi:hypothetical protein
MKAADLPVCRPGRWPSGAGHGSRCQQTGHRVAVMWAGVEARRAGRRPWSRLRGLVPAAVRRHRELEPQKSDPQRPVTASSRSNPHPPRTPGARHRNYRWTDGVVSIPAHRIESHLLRATAGTSPPRRSTACRRSGRARNSAAELKPRLISSAPMRGRRAAAPSGAASNAFVTESPGASAPRRDPMTIGAPSPCFALL